MTLAVVMRERDEGAQAAVGSCCAAVVRAVWRVSLQVEQLYSGAIGLHSNDTGEANFKLGLEDCIAVLWICACWGMGCTLAGGRSLQRRRQFSD
jgi:hypothetical protein